VVDRLRALILSRHLKPGERLVQSELAERLGVSRTPVREALHKLAAEGLVTISHYKGASVAALSRAELEGIYSVRTALEGYAAFLAAQHLTDEDLDVLDALLLQMKEAYQAGDRVRLLEVNRQFYLCLYKAARQQRLYEMIINHLDLASLYRQIYFWIDHLAANTVAEHENLLRALRQRDAQKAEQLTRVYLHKTASGLIDFFESVE
jgi:DNA-binding GntR family transcriptional regulator